MPRLQNPSRSGPIPPTGQHRPIHRGGIAVGLRARHRSQILVLRALIGCAGCGLGRTSLECVEGRSSVAGVRTHRGCAVARDDRAAGDGAASARRAAQHGRRADRPDHAAGIVGGRIRGTIRAVIIEPMRGVSNPMKPRQERPPCDRSVDGSQAPGARIANAHRPIARDRHSRVRPPVARLRHARTAHACGNRCRQEAYPLNGIWRCIRHGGRRRRTP